MKATRAEVFNAIDAERLFQDALAEAAHGDPANAQQKPLESFSLYLNHYVLQLQTQLTTVWGPEAYEQPLHTLRKIAALAVAAQEIHGVRYRMHTQSEVDKRVPFPAETPPDSGEEAEDDDIPF